MGFTSDLIEQIRALANRIRNLELSVYSYGSQPSNPPTSLVITNLQGVVAYYTEPNSLLARASVQWSWQAPSAGGALPEPDPEEDPPPPAPDPDPDPPDEPDDPISHYMVSITKTTDNTTGAFTNVGNVTALTTSGHPINTNVIFRVYAVSSKGIIGPTSSATVVISKTSIAPPQPNAPTVIAGIKGARVQNDGKDSSGNDMPDDLAYYEIHKLDGGAIGFTPTTATLWSRMAKLESVFVTGNDSYAPMAIRLVAVNTSGLKSGPSTGVLVTPKKIVDSDSDITLPSGTAFSDTGNLLVDGSFEDSRIRSLRVPTGSFSYQNGVGQAQHGEFYLKANVATPTGTYSFTPSVVDTNPLAQFAVQGGEKLYIGAQIRNIGANGSVTLVLAVTLNDGTTELLTTTATAATVNTGDWEIVHAVVTIPARGYKARFYIALNTDNTAGEWHFDAVQVRRVLSTVLIEDGAITRAKIGDLAVGTQQVEELDAQVIKSGYLDANRIDAGSIEARHVRFGAIGKAQLTPSIGTDIDIADNAALADMASQTQLDDLTGNVTEIADEVNALNNVITIDTDGVTITQEGSPFRVNLNNQSLDFYEGDARTVYINGQKLYIRSAEITEQLKLGVHIIEKYDATNTFIRWVG